MRDSPRKGELNVSELQATSVAAQPVLRPRARAHVRQRLSLVRSELRKLPAFLRRDLLIAWSYRLSFFSEWVTLAIQALLFYFLGQLVGPLAVPGIARGSVSYMEFVAVGIALGGFVQIALRRVADGLRGEQMTGTLESLLMTPTAPATVQIGTVLYDLIYVPVRTVVFLVIVTVAFGLDFEPMGLLPAALIMLAFIPFIWGLGIVNAGFLLTFRRGASVGAIGVTILTAFSGAYFPLSLLPDWVEPTAALNPIAIAVDGMRKPLLDGPDWSAFGGDLLVLVPISLLSLLVGAVCFRFALRREARRGSLGLY